jgi:hypothetical protein
MKMAALRRSKLNYPIWVPSRVTVESRPPMAYLRYGKESTPTFVYEVPEGRWPQVTHIDLSPSVCWGGTCGRIHLDCSMTLCD